MAFLKRIFGSPAVRAALVLGLVFAAGVMVGVVLDRALFRGPARLILAERPGPPDVSMLVDRLRKSLGLNPEQADRVRALLEERQPRIREEWITARRALLAQADTTMDGLEAILTPEQYQRLVRRLRARGLPLVNQEPAPSSPATGQ